MMKRIFIVFITATLCVTMGRIQIYGQNPTTYKDSLRLTLNVKSAEYDTLFKAFLAKNRALVNEIELLGNAISIAQNQETKAGNLAFTTIKVDQDLHHFGMIKEGQVVAHIFTVLNTGAYQLIIKDIKTTCGCTVPEWPKDPIEPGKTAEIKVTFNSDDKGLPGGLEMVKKVTIIANTDPVETYLSMRGFVKK